jgi:hypothetical protein
MIHEHEGVPLPSARNVLTRTQAKPTGSRAGGDH